MAVVHDPYWEERGRRPNLADLEYQTVSASGYVTVLGMTDDDMKRAKKQERKRKQRIGFKLQTDKQAK